MHHHLVVLQDHYLDLILKGRKHIECRLSKNRRPPFRAVSPGDLLWIKLPSREVRALAMAGRCSFHELHDPADLVKLIDRHAGLICAKTGFFDGAESWARFASFIWIETLIMIQPMPVYKSDQRAWVALDQMPYPGMRIGRPASRIIGRT